MPGYKDRPTQFGEHTGFYHPDDWVAKFEYEFDQNYKTEEERQQFSSWVYTQLGPIVIPDPSPGMSGVKKVVYTQSPDDVLELLIHKYLKLDPQYGVKEQLSPKEFQAIKKIWDKKLVITLDKPPRGTTPTPALTEPSAGDRGPRMLGLLLFIGLVIGIAIGVGVGIAIGGPIGAAVGAMIGFVVGPVVGGYIGNRIDKWRLKSVISAREQALEQYEKSISPTTDTDTPDSAPKPTVEKTEIIHDPKSSDHPQYDQFQERQNQPQEQPKTGDNTVVSTPADLLKKP